MTTKSVGTFGINSVFASGSLVFYEKAVGRTATGDVFTVGTAAVKVGGTAQDVDFQFYGTGSLSVIIDAGAATLTLVGITTSTDKPLTITDATESTSTITGALIVSGGIANAKDTYLGDDLFLTSGAVINFNAGDVTLTHSANNIAVAGGTTTLAGLVMTDATNIVLNATTGTKIGTATTEKLGFYNVTPVVQPSAYTQTYATADKTHAAMTSSDMPAGGTGTAAGGWDTAANRDTAIADFAELRVDVIDLKQLVNSVIDDLQVLGLAA